MGQLSLVDGSYYFLRIGAVSRCSSGSCADDLTDLVVTRLPQDQVVDGDWVYWVQTSEPNDGIVARTRRR